MIKSIPIFDLIYPRRCPICQEIIPYGAGKLACDTCRRRVPYIRGNRCMKCGKPVESEDMEYCFDCASDEKHYEKGYPLMLYTKDVKQGVLAMKYHNRREYAEFYSQEMLKEFAGEWKAIRFDGIVPVPVHRHRRRVRGYNQAELLAYPIGKALEVRVYNKLLIRTTDTKPQKDLDDKERLKNIKNAFIIGQNKVELNKVLLIDDIYTSGATIEACTNALHRGGVSQVYYTSICIGKGY